MHEDRDDIASAFDPLRSQRWDRPEHRHELEAKLMEEFSTREARAHRSWSRAALIAAALVLAGGVAGASSAILLKRWHIIETPTQDGRRQVEMQDEQGKTVFRGELEEDEALFSVEDENGDEQILQVKPCDPPDDGNGADDDDGEAQIDVPDDDGKQGDG